MKLSKKMGDNKACLGLGTETAVCTGSSNLLIGVTSIFVSIFFILRTPNKDAMLFYGHPSNAFREGTVGREAVCCCSPVY